MDQMIKELFQMDKRVIEYMVEDFKDKGYTKEECFRTTKEIEIDSTLQVMQNLIDKYGKNEELMKNMKNYTDHTIQFLEEEIDQVYNNGEEEWKANLT